MIVKIFLSVIFFIYVLKVSYYLLNLFQQNHYDNIKFLKSTNKYYFKCIYQYFYYISLLFLCLSYYLKYFYIVTGLLVLGSFIFKNKYIIKLKFTPRIKRLIITCAFICILIVLCFLKIDIIIYLIPIFLPFVIILANFINKPFEKIIKRKFLKKAIIKLEKIKPLKCAITGSFGKTSCKNIIYEILNGSYNVYKTPHSYNTLMGLSKSINEDLPKETEIFLMEMGAFFKGEIKEMTKSFMPTVVMITEVGMQHLSTFKTIENIINAKLEITSYLTPDDILILNVENDYLRNVSFDKFNTENIYTYGINHGMFNARNIVFDKNKTKFDIYKENDFLISITTKLLGLHNVLNILGSFTLVTALRKKNINIDINKISKNIAKIKGVKSRLEYKENGMFHIYDDSYSSNIVGFKNACEVVLSQEGKKVIITPGIVDSGIYDKEINQSVCSVLNKGFDDIILVNNKSSKYIEEKLKEDNIRYKVFSSFKDAYSYVINKYNNTNDVINILIENDLPDCYLER